MLRRELPKTKTNARKTEEKLSQTLLTSTCSQATGQSEKRRKRKDYTFWRQSDERPRTIPGCLGLIPLTAILLGVASQHDSDASAWAYIKYDEVEEDKEDVHHDPHDELQLADNPPGILQGVRQEQQWEGKGQGAREAGRREANLDDSIPHVGQRDFAIPVHIQCLQSLRDLFWRHEELQIHGHNEVPVHDHAKMSSSSSSASGREAPRAQPQPPRSPPITGSETRPLGLRQGPKGGHSLLLALHALGHMEEAGVNVMHGSINCRGYAQGVKPMVALGASHAAA
ncbi:MAG: hypothetical protein FRX49_02130 [Trebouxia sp. A1-2]|nr:MAG: hypothetical protein FRX49_02130 [Trebouxia sp. A1-2]